MVHESVGEDGVEPPESLTADLQSATLPLRSILPRIRRATTGGRLSLQQSAKNKGLGWEGNIRKPPWREMQDSDLRTGGSLPSTV